MKEEDKEADEEEEEHEDKGEFILEEEDDRMDYQNEIPDTQDEEATFIRTWETANLLSIAQLGDIYLMTRKLTPKQADGATDLLAAIDKVFDLDLCIQTIDDEGKATSDVRKAVARMKSGMIKEAWLEALEATRKAALRKLERQMTSMVGKLNHIDSTLTAIKVATGTASYEEQKAVENVVKKNKVEEIKKVAEEKARQGEKKAKASYAQAAKKEEEGKQKVEEADQGLAEKTEKLRKLAQQLQAGPNPYQLVRISKEMGDLAKEVKKDEETSWWSMSEEEAAQEGQAWSKVGTKGRYVDIATAFFADVPQEPKDPRIKAKMDKANEVLEKLTSGGGIDHPTFRVVKLEPIPQISLREMRWRIGPISNDIQASYVAKQMTEQVFPEVFTAVGGGKGVHYAFWDRG